MIALTAAATTSRLSRNRFGLGAFEEPIPNECGQGDAGDVLKEIGPVGPVDALILKSGDEFREDGDGEWERPLPALAGDEENEDEVA